MNRPLSAKTQQMLESLRLSQPKLSLRRKHNVEDGPEIGLIAFFSLFPYGSNNAFALDYIRKVQS